MSLRPLACDVVDAHGLVSIYLDCGPLVLVVVRGRCETRAWWRTRGHELVGSVVVGSA